MSDSEPDRDISRNDSEVKEGTFWLARNVLLRCLGLIYFLAFLIALDQNKRLFGKNGLIPYKTSNTHLRDTINRLADTEQEAIFYHSLPYDNVLAFLTRVGLSLSLSLVFRGAANWLLMLCLWTIYHVLVDAGLQRPSFGWQFQLLETGFLATFLCPVWSLRQPPTSRAVIRGFKWMFFRIMWGWSYDKIRRDRVICSTYFTCMNYHYQTTPFSTDTNFPKTWEYQFYIYHVLAPYLLVYGRRMTIIAGAIGIFSQCVLLIPTLMLSSTGFGLLVELCIKVFAFLIALHQNKQLFGKEGFLPNNASVDLGDIINRLASADREGVLNVPKIAYWFFNVLLPYTSNTDLKYIIKSLADTDRESVIDVPKIVYWFFNDNKPDENTLVFITHVGLALSLSLIIRGAANWVLMLCLWTIYSLLVDAGQQWHSFGWEFQLLETGFLATFLCPVWSLRQPPTSRAVIRGFKWMFFRIMWGLSYDKFRRDRDICSTYFTCMNYHYQTTPFSLNSDCRETRLDQFYIYHVFAPCFLIYGRRMTIIAGAIGIYSQVSLIYSGDLSLFNWLNIVPCLACFDDRCVCWLLPGRLRRQIAYKQELRQTEGLKMFNLCLGLFITLRSILAFNRMVHMPLPGSHPEQMGNY